MRVLLVEDNPDDAELIRKNFEAAARARFRIQHCDMLEAGLQELKQNPDVEVVLLDLNLPDSEGLDTLDKLRQQKFPVAIVVLTGEEDEELGRQAIQQGAQDFLVKGRFNEADLARSLQYAVERVKRGELENKQALEKEIGGYADYSRPPSSSVTAASFQIMTFREEFPEVYEKLRAKYIETIETAIEETLYSVERKASSKLREMSEILIAHRAGPKDLVEIHANVLKEISKKAVKYGDRAMAVEGRLVLLELMGNMMAAYRNIAIGMRPVNSMVSSNREGK